MKYDFKQIYMSGDWKAQLDEAGGQGFRVVACVPNANNHVIIMERESTEGQAFMREWGNNGPK